MRYDVTRTWYPAGGASLMVLLVIIILLCASGAFGKNLDPKDYPLTATIISEEHSSDWHPYGISVSDREEIKIGDTIYITSVLHGQIDGKVGDSFPARLGRSHGLQVVYLLGVDRHGKPTVASLEITGQRMAQ